MAEQLFRARIVGEADLKTARNEFEKLKKDIETPINLKLDSSAITKASADFDAFKKKVETPITITFNTSGLNATWNAIQKQAQNAGVNIGQQMGQQMANGISRTVTGVKVKPIPLEQLFDTSKIGGSIMASLGADPKLAAAFKKQLEDINKQGAILRNIEIGDTGKTFKAQIESGETLINVLGKLKNGQWEFHNTYFTDFEKGAKQAQAAVDELAKHLQEVQSAFDSGSFTAKMDQMEAKLSNIGKDVSSDKVKAASDAAAEYYQIAMKIQGSLNGTATNPLVGQDLVNAFEQLKASAVSFDNAMVSVNASAKTMGVNTGNAVKQALNETQKLVNAVNEVKKLNTEGLFDKNLTKMEGGLLGINGSASSELIKKASDAAVQYYNVVKQIQETIAGTAQNPLTDEQLAGAYKDSIVYLNQFNNAMDQIHQTSQKMLADGVGERDADKLVGWAKKNTRALKEYGNQIDELVEKLRNVKTVGERSDVLNQVNNLKAKINAEGLSGLSFVDQIKKAFSHIGQFTFIYGLTSKLQQLPNEMFQEVYKIDTAMTELRKVSTATASELSNYFDQATESASKYGQTINEVIDATASWTRLGYDLEGASELTDVTLELARVGSGLNVSTATEGLQATLRGFGLAVEDAKSVADSINAVSDSQPIDALGLINGLERSSAAMREMNNSLEETIGLITASTSVTQDATSAGTAWRTKYKDCANVQKCA